MADIVTSVTAAISLAKQLTQLAAASKNAEIKMVIADLSVELAEVKMKLAELMDENTQLKEKLKVARGGGPVLEFRNGLYFDAEGNGPFCPGCYDASKKAIRLTKQKPPFNDFGDYKCPACDEFFNDT